MLIRPAEIKDAADIQDLIKQLGYTLSIEEMTKKINEYCTRKHHCIFVVEHEGIVAGVISVCCYESFIKVGAGMHIEALVVDSNHQRKGIGKKLIAAAEQYAKGHNCYIIELVSLNKRKEMGTHAFYENLGYDDHHKIGTTYFSKIL